MRMGTVSLVQCSNCSSSTSLEGSFLCFQFHHIRAPNCDWKLLEICLVLTGSQVFHTTTLKPPKLARISLRQSGKKVSEQSTCTGYFCERHWHWHCSTGFNMV